MLRRDVLIGFAWGVAAAMAGFALLLLALSDGGLVKTLTLAHQKKLLGSLAALGALLNLFVFFWFIKKRSDYKARGVLMATFLIALLLIAYKFF
jgi:hypothetical protein